ncbi:MAG: putative metal-binding motif-containing protein [Myxococcota bacterium]
MKTSRHPVIALVGWGALALVLGGANCDPSALVGGEAIAVGGAGGDAGTGNVECTSDDACPFGQVCRENRCRPSDQNLHDEGCHTDDDCPADHACAESTGRCIPVAPNPPLPGTDAGQCTSGQTRPCGNKIGACEYGEETCVDGAWNGACVGGVGPVDERCDALDNDCDGTTDEGFTLGGACADGEGVCRQEGTVVCTEDGLGTGCSVTALDPGGRVELCSNGLDDDCDGETDEGFTLGEVCTAGLGACERSGVTVCSQDRLSVTCNAVAGDPEPLELCGNDVDDDCNGQTDEGFEALDTPCSDGVGICQRNGVRVCAQDLLALRCSVTAAAPGPRELCGNDLDDDCDNQTDEDFDNVVGTACAVGTPPCQTAGTWACTADATDKYCQLPLVGGELCNGINDNADSCVDEGYDVGEACAAGVGECRQTGTKVCAADEQSTECSVTGLDPTGRVELCGNGLDDNCNGQPDEGFPDLGTSCAAGVGVCRRTGARVCAADRLSTVCDAVAAAPDPRGELCGDNQDNDCDSSTDEGFDLGTVCTVGQGICQRTGAKVCSSDRTTTVCSAAAGPPNANGELCGNGLDDDCDGVTDEGFNNGTACTAGTGACARNGTWRCSVDLRSTYCDATAAPAGTELCSNGVDDDCDSFTDEGFANLGNACTVGVGACLASGNFVCSADRLSTVCNATQGTGTPEQCDNVDNDCNSIVDNGCDDDADDYCDASMTVVGSPSACPLSSGSSNLDCNDTDGTIHPNATEQCGDARDQDCDGNNNNGCNCGPVPDADFDGVNSSACGGNDCDDTNGAIYPGATERCDGVDNDCDGVLDDGFDADGDNYTTCGTVRPAGGLDPAYVDCDDGNANRKPFACELCANASGTVACGAANDRGNNVDEDCDGYLDETCAPCDNVDRDGDGLSECDGDCAPSDNAVSPARVEDCDGKDTDCNRTTVDNCNVGDPCNWPGYPTAADDPPDECADRLICVESLAGNNRPTGDFTCTSFCNMTPQGAGLGDGCTAGQTCLSSLTPTANLHGCTVNSVIGTKSVGQSCNNDDECRSGNCFRDPRLTGSAAKYCSDLCGSDAYCGNGTTCQNYVDNGQCWKLLASQTFDVGTACNGATDYQKCMGGWENCITVGAGKICTETCCRDSDCPSGYHCSLDGNDSAGPIGGYDTAPVCYPDGSGAHDRPAGAACTSNGQCQSEFCDRNLNVCVDVCCHDGTCPTGLRCEQALVTRAGGHQSFARMCLNLSPTQALEKR